MKILAAFNLLLFGLCLFVATVVVVDEARAAFLGVACLNAVAFVTLVSVLIDE